jgi:serine/threonine-protein kinase
MPPLDAAILAASALLAVLVGALVSLRRRASPRIGTVLMNRYELVERVGEGGMGTVYLGWDRAERREVAVKRLRRELQNSARHRERFLAEARLVSSLRHPNVVEILDIVGDERSTHLIFEYIVGRTVHETLNASPGRHVPPEQALAILGQAAAAVDYAHSCRVIHRDLKPANLMIDGDGRVKVMDFGIAREVEESLAAVSRTIVGTPTYMAPEQARGAASAASDVYSLGVTLYELLTGGLPFKGPDEMRDKLEGRFLAPSALLPGLAPGFDRVLARALAPRPEDRFASGAELIRSANAAFRPFAVTQRL